MEYQVGVHFFCHQDRTLHYHIIIHETKMIVGCRMRKPQTVGGTGLR